MQRRTSIKKIFWAAGSGLILPGVNANAISQPFSHMRAPGPFYLFTKVLQWLPLSELPDTVKTLGFEGIDLPVRKNGFFDKDELSKKLPAIVAESERLGLNRPVLTTDMNVRQMNQMDEFLRILAGEGIKDYRMGYLSFTSKDIVGELKRLNGEMRRLAELHAKHGVTGHYQNHAGKRIGGSVWEIYHLLEGIDPDHIGVQFDLRHSQVEGYQSYENVFHLISDQIRSFDLKDFVWGNPSNKKDQPVNVPLGKGNVNFQLLMEHEGFTGSLPKILHVEYDLGGAEHGDSSPTMDKKEILAAIEKDVMTYRQIMS
ncbi:sugar phosphate isomerase/epimerase family protein [Cyclobacterium salsum]|uniref:sugar phosphate isomerase/epimerase family protein n=1 Tax=Cyclobacterium salsum TaxID=2666329 RepID=UPI001390C474|nr:TIM barrel protein [Cyclobacterium salsum]